MKLRNVLRGLRSGHVATVLSLLVAGAARGQSNTTSNMPLRDPATGSISGRVMLPSGVASGKHLKIALSNTQSPITTIYSEKGGEFAVSPDMRGKVRTHFCGHLELP